MAFKSIEAHKWQTAGLNEESDLFAPSETAVPRRVAFGSVLIYWTAFLASAFIGLFEARWQQVVALAVLMPVVASMGGIAGSPNTDLIVRGLATGQITRSNFKVSIVQRIKSRPVLKRRFLWSYCDRCCHAFGGFESQCLPSNWSGYIVNIVNGRSFWVC